MIDESQMDPSIEAKLLSTLTRAERLAALGELSGGIAHEIRNPLNTIKTSIYFLMHAEELSQSKIREHLERIDRQVALIDSVVTTLSNMIRMPVPSLRRLNLKQEMECA